jgi:signal transduction histidine kinase
MGLKLSLSTRILVILSALALLTLFGGGFTLWYSVQTDTFFSEVLDKNMAALQAADRLEIALVMQKGYLTYYFQDGNPQWLEELQERNSEFKQWLEVAASYIHNPDERLILEDITMHYSRLTPLREQVIALYKDGRKEEGYALHQTARGEFFKILELVAKYRKFHEQRMIEARHKADQRSGYMNRLAKASIPLSIILSIALALILWRQLLGPIRRLARQADYSGGDIRRGDELQALSRGVHHLMEDVDTTRSELEASRVRLLQAAKMASVGKLAASVAHSIRNPLTSVKMRLFSLERNLSMDSAQKEDFTVIAEEIRHIDNVLRNFLEYSRRPKLKFQRISPSSVVDMALDLVGPRLESHAIQLDLRRSDAMPEIDADPGQLKEAIVNLLVNASEALGPSGSIVITETIQDDLDQGRSAIIGIGDNGPGIPEALRDQVFQLFFSTKDEGTGLGLSIASRIIEEHGGLLNLTESESGGALFTIKLPLREDYNWPTS